MSARVFQSALARLIVDPEFRDDLQARREAALPAELTDLERERLLAVSGDPGLDVTRMLHKGFRLVKLLGQLPLTCAVLGREVLAQEAKEFWRRRLPVSFYFLEEAIAFCDHLLARESAGELQCLYLAEIAAYERAILELQRPRPDGTPPPLQAVGFSHDPLPLIAALAQGEVPPAVNERQCRMVGIRTDAKLEWYLEEPSPAS